MDAKTRAKIKRQELSSLRKQIQLTKNDIAEALINDHPVHDLKEALTKMLHQEDEMTAPSKDMWKQMPDGRWVRELQIDQTGYTVQGKIDHNPETDECQGTIELFHADEVHLSTSGSLIGLAAFKKRLNATVAAYRNIVRAEIS